MFRLPPHLQLRCFDRGLRIGECELSWSVEAPVGDDDAAWSKMTASVLPHPSPCIPSMGDMLKPSSAVGSASCAP